MCIEFGMPTLIELTGLEENAKLCHSLGLKFIELNMNLPEYQLNGLKELDFFQAVSDRYKIYYTLHLDENLNISDFNPAVTDAYLNTVAQTIEIAKQLKIPLLNMHMNKGVYFTLPTQKVFLFDRYRNIYLEKIHYFKVMCENLIGEHDILIAVENTGGYAPFQKEAIDILLEGPVFALTWDIGHSHSADDVDEKYILQNEHRLKHFHVHDARGKQNHLALGTGDVNLLERLDIVKRNRCRCVLETKNVESLQQSVKWLKDIFHENKFL